MCLFLKPCLPRHDHIRRRWPLITASAASQILFRMLKEVVRFGVVIGVVLLGFAMAMYALFGGELDVMEESTSSESTRRGINDDDTTAGELSFNPFGR